MTFDAVLVVIAFTVLAAVVLWNYPAQTALAAVVIALGMYTLQLGTDGIDAGITIYPEDIACLVLLAAAAVVVLRKLKLPGSTSWPLLTLFALVVVNLIRGANAFGLKAAGNGARTLAYLVVPALALTLVGPMARLDPRRVAIWVARLGCALAIVAGCRWIGALATPEQEDKFREIYRVLSADDAMVIGQAFLATIGLQFICGVRWWRVGLAGILAAVTIGLQHRSVWAATLVGLTWLSISSLRSSRKRWFQLATSTLFVLTLAAEALLAAGGMGRVVSIVRTNLEETQGDKSTWSWRVDGFTEVTDRVFSSSVSELVFGPPSGRDLGSSASFSSVHIHSRYVDTVGYYGVFGSFVLTMWLLNTARKIGGWVRPVPGESPEGHGGTAFLQALLLSQLTYFIAYRGGMAQGTFIALIWLTAGVYLQPYRMSMMDHAVGQARRVITKRIPARACVS